MPQATNTTTAATTATTTNTAVLAPMKGRVQSLSITKTGMVLVTVSLPDGKSGKALLRKEQMETLALYFGGLPKKGTEVEASWSVSPSTGEISDEWLEMAL